MITRVQNWVATWPRWLFAPYAGVLAFGTYFAMYAFRRPFAAASYAEVALPGLRYKAALVIAQVIGYALAKFIGVRVIAELPPSRRIVGILLQIACAELALIGFALIPAPWNIACLFVDGLALGMIWGMVFGFVEGRRESDVIAAMLCASFIVSSGVVKSVGEAVMLGHLAGPFWMPAVTGAIFAPLLLLCVAGLATLPPPSAADVAARVERVPMDRAARGAFLSRYAPVLIALVVIYVALTALRDFRDNFAAEIWIENGYGGRADVFTATELPISVAVLVALASLNVFRNNIVGLTANLALVGFGLALTGLASLAFMGGVIGPVLWMTAIGGGLYLAYTPFNGMLFDRLIAATGERATAGFLIYVADAAGYAGSVGLILFQNFGLHQAPGARTAWTGFVLATSLGTAVLGLVLLAWVAIWFTHHFSRARA